jgi:hypothetical protein
VISAEEKETLIQQLGEAEDWLYDTEDLTPQLCQSKKVRSSASRVLESGSQKVFSV